MPAATSSNSQESDDFDEWLRAYAAGQLGPADRTPAPPPAIAAIIAEESQSRSASPSSPASSSKEEMYLLAGNSSGLSVDVTEEPSALEQYRLRGHLMAPKAPFEEDRLKLAIKFGLDQPRRRAALDAICRVVKRVFKMKTVVISL